MVAYCSWHMLKAPPFRLEGALNRRRNCGSLQRKSKKILNRGNEPKDLLETQHLAVFWSKKRTQNELDFECKKRLSKRKSRFRVPSSRCQVQEEQVSGVRGQKCGCLGVLCGPAAGGLLPARTRSRECIKRDEKPATGQAAQRIKRQPGTWLLLLDPRLSTSRLREIERPMRECL
jgi:hypothetical protein